MLKQHLSRLIYISLVVSSIVSTITFTSQVSANTDIFKGGHTKYRFLLNTLADDSLLLDYVDTPMIDHNGDLRLKFDWRKDNVSLVADYQLIAQYGDSFTLANNSPGSVIISDPIVNDDRRLFDLSRVITDDTNSAISHRLDRLYVEYTGTDTVGRFGRQAISWGNGLVYTPMDFINPFDPSAIDKEYKTGDDMLYGQYLQHSGDDVQAVWVFRRDLNGDVTNDVDTIAAKYHGFAGNQEYDLLLAQHYEDNIFGIGALTDIGGAIWRGGITLTDTKTDNVTSLVTSLSYSWIGWDHNFSGVLEYFYNGFGQANGDYSPAALANNPDLVARIIRGELFTLGRHYVVASAIIEMTPLWMLTPNVFINASDGSFLAQLVSSYDLRQDWQLLVAIGVPVGATGTEYGGIDSAVAGKQLSTEFNLFAQLAWYF